MDGGDFIVFFCFLAFGRLEAVRAEADCFRAFRDMLELERRRRRVPEEVPEGGGFEEEEIGREDGWQPEEGGSDGEVGSLEEGFGDVFDGEDGLSWFRCESATAGAHFEESIAESSLHFRSL